MSETNPPQAAPAWVMLLQIKVGEDANTWLTTRKYVDGASFRDLADEVTHLIGFNVSHETLRRHLLTVAESKTAS